ncbi:hypothetical protein D3C81_1903660 [compost metagenome]
MPAWQLAEWQPTVLGPDQRALGQQPANSLPLVRSQVLGLVQQQQPGAGQRLLLRGGQWLAGGQRLGVEHHHARLERQHPLPGSLAQLPEQLCRMAETRRFDEQAIGT